MPFFKFRSCRSLVVDTVLYSTVPNVWILVTLTSSSSPYQIFGDRDVSGLRFEACALRNWQPNPLPLTGRSHLKASAVHRVELAWDLSNSPAIASKSQHPPFLFHRKTRLDFICFSSWSLLITLEYVSLLRPGALDAFARCESSVFFF